MNEWTGLSDAEVETIYAAYDTVAGSEAKSTEGKRAIVEPIYRAVIQARVQTAQMNALRDQVEGSRPAGRTTCPLNGHRYDPDPEDEDLLVCRRCGYVRPAETP